MFEELKKNIEQEKKIIADIHAINSAMASSPDKKFYESSLNALFGQLRIINNSIPFLISPLSPVKSLEPAKAEAKKAPEVVKISYVSPISKEKRYITINKQDKENFAKQLQISESGLSSLKKLKSSQETAMVNKPSELAVISSKIFSSISDGLTPKFRDLGDDLKRANIRFLTSTYISIALFVSSILFILGWIVFGLLLVINFAYFSFVWIPFLLFLISLTGFYLYPSSEKNSVQKNITQELPFATIHMAAIAGSNIEPTKIFKIIASSNEYPTVGLELRKVINQTDLYGYDLVTALKNSAKQTSNSRLAEMFNGLATNISSGGNLKNYLEKKADNFLMDYSLERQRYNDLAGTFMDVYISVLITAPLILMMMFIVMNISGLGIGLSLDTLLLLSIVGVVLINIIFIVVLEAKQPKN